MSVKWFDAVCYSNKDERFIDKPIKVLLSKQVTYGRVYREDKDGLIVVTSESKDLDGEENFDFVVVPKKWLRS